jgi:predicted transcriptional regulator YdeE
MTCKFLFFLEKSMTNKWLFLGVFLIALAFAQPTIADSTYRVFDKDGRVTEIWKEKNALIEVYNPDMSRKGYIRKESDRLELYDKAWRREGTILKETDQSEGKPQPRK